MPYRKKGTFVHISDTKALKQHFSSWPACQVFKVDEHRKSTNGKAYIWVESMSMGIDPKNVVVKTATPAQIKQYKLDKKLNRVTLGQDVRN